MQNNINLDNSIISQCETSVNSIVRYMPNKFMEDQVDYKQKSKDLQFRNRRWYQFWV